MALVVDRDLAGHDADLAERVKVMTGLDFRLACIDASQGKDDYHVLQGLVDTTVHADDPKCCYFYQRWGSTGSRGNIKLDGPLEQPKVESAMAKVFKDLTGHDMGSLLVGQRVEPNHYWVQEASVPDFTAKWEYYVSDGVDGKRTGWYPYEVTASEEVEEIYAQYVANPADERSHVRTVHSGYFSYKVDLTKMTQQNTRTKKQRTIRRSFGDSSEAAPRAPMKRAMKAARVKVAPAKAPALRGKSASAVRSTKVIKAMKKAKTARKAMKVMKAMKAMKKKLSKVGSRRSVFAGKKVKTKTGLKKEQLVKSKSGKICSSKKVAHGHKHFKNIEKWVNAMKTARKELGLTGFVAVKKGTAYYDKTKALYMAS
jgi:hypothetical protein